MSKGMKNQRVIVFAAYPRWAGQLGTIFSTAEGSIRRKLENPPILRQRGWALQTFDHARIIRGEMIRVEFEEEKTIDLYRDGSLIFVALADHNFLGWDSSRNGPRITPIAIVEVVYNFINFYKLVLEDFVEKPEVITIRVDFRNMHLHGIKTHLNPFNWADESGRRYAPDNNGTITKDFRGENFHVGVIAFEILKEIYLWFGWEEDKIPYTKTEGELKMVDPEAIANIK
ncbi:hypothetical protein HYR99_38485 [Candidatus Poribacteria bacterium]|nr:hypothetical protein [Candidatus Poribacteria bacterium]